MRLPMLIVAVGSATLWMLPAQAQFPPIPVPVENPLTAEKSILGKFLFWEEQLSSDNAVACGTCHIPSAGGSDPRAGLGQSSHPGTDGVFGTADDAAGSIGVVAQTCGGSLVDDGTFYPQRQVTPRRSPTFIGIMHAPTLFWEGRAGGTFIDPETGLVAIAANGALESQAVEPILSSVEMACDGRTWDDVRTKLQSVVPMALANSLPPDMEAALLVFPNYPALFQAAFGTPDISAVRIGFAIASYERTLVPDQTPFDAFLDGDLNAMTPAQFDGFDLFNDNCQVCHDRNLLTDNAFHNIGVRPGLEDIGREAVTGDPLDRGKFRTPALRNVKLRAPYFHNGGKASLLDVVSFYNLGGDFSDNLDPEIVPLGLTNPQLQNLVDFLENALTDPRVEDELSPFDRPELQTYFQRGDSNRDGLFNIGDPIHALEYLFSGSIPLLLCADATDANDDGVINIADPIAMLARLFQSAPPLPTPSDISFGPDPTPDALGCR